MLMPRWIFGGDVDMILLDGEDFDDDLCEFFSIFHFLVFFKYLIFLGF